MPASPAASDELRGPYAETICPIFDALVAIDPQLNDLRAVAQEGADMAAEQESMAALSDGILVILDELETLPAWEPGAALRFHLTNSLHGIRARLLRVGRDPSAPDAASTITAMPFIATDALDRAMSAATQGGLVCESGL